MKNLGNLVYIEDKEVGGCFIKEADILSREEALTPTGRVKRRYNKFETEDEDIVIYAVGYTKKHNDQMYDSDDNGWCKPDYNAKPWGMWVNLAEPYYCGTVITQYLSYGSSRGVNKIVYF